VRRTLIAVLVCGLIYLLGITVALAYNEAPMLRTKVAAGELPPVEERLPEKPLVVEPVEEIGQYGGTAHVASTFAEAFMDGSLLMGWEGLLRIGPDNKSIIPNLAKKWEFSKDGKTLTIYLRKGIKWSDGVPFTADDIMFWYEDMFLNEELTPVKSKDLCPGGEPIVVEKVNDYTVRFHFAVPYPIMKLYLAHYGGLWLFYPKHYLMQFHPRYVPLEKLEKMAKDEGFDYWYQLFGDKIRTGFIGAQTNPDRPVLEAFVLRIKKPDHLVLERNPYYWKVDPAGNQLPYIDKIFVHLVTDVETANAMVVSGQLDFAGMNTTLTNYPLYKDSAAKGNFRVLTWPSCYGGMVIFQPNQTHKDPVLRKIFRDVRFRRALSLAINREEINDVLYFGLGEPRQMTVVPQSKFYEDRFARAYAEYDPEKANALLDEMGLKWDENHEYRLRPDGKRLSWTIEYWPGEIATKTPTCELVREYWRKIGIQVALKEETGELTTQRATSNEMDMNVWHGDKVADILFILSPQFFVPYSRGWETTWGVEWATWYVTGGKEGEKPPEKAMNLLKWWEKMKTTMDEEEMIQLGKKILASQAENLWTIGTVGLAPQPIVVRNNLRNIPEKGLWGWDVLWTEPCHPEQFFFKQR